MVRVVKFRGLSMLKVKKLVLSLLLVLLGAESFAQQWTSGIVPYWRDVNDAVFTESNVLVAVGGRRVNDAIEGIYRTPDFGNTFSPMADAPGTSWLRSVHFANSLVGYASGDEGKLLRTLDAGLSWEPLESGVTVNMYCIMAPTESMAFAVGGGGVDDRFILATADGGSEWETVHQSAGTQLNGIHMSSVTDGVAVGHGGTVLITTDGWQTPVPDASPTVADLYAVTASPDGALYAVGGLEGTSVIIRKENAGSAWEAVLDGAGDILKDVQFLNADTAYATGGQTLLMSADGGDTWMPITVPDPEFEIEFDLQTVAVAPGPILFLMGSGGQYFRYAASNLTPTVQTGDASVIGNGSLQFNGVVFSAGMPGVVSFLYGTDPTLATSTETVGTDVQTAMSIAVSEGVNGLQTDAEYFYRCKLQLNSGAVYLGNIHSVELPHNPMVLELFPASMVNSASAVLNARVKMLPSSATVSFEVTMPGGEIVEIPASPSYIEDGGLYDVEGMLTGLAPNTSYPYSLKVVLDDLPLFPVYQGELHVYTGSNTIPNPDFEEWELVEGEKPDVWMNIFGPVSRVSPGHESPTAVRMEATPSARGAILQGFIGEDVLAFTGIPYMSRPDSVFGYFRYAVMEGDTAFLVLGFKSSEEVISMEFFPITGSSEGAGFQRMAFPIEYSSEAIPDEMFLALTSCNVVNRDIPEISGSWIEADNIGFGDQHPPVANGDFEAWSDYSYQRPTGWAYAEHSYMGVYNDPDQQVVSQTDDSQNGEQALHIQNVVLAPFLVMNGRMSTGQNDEDDSPSFPVGHRPHALNGQFKFIPATMDTLVIECRLYEAGQLVGTGAFQYSDSVTDYGVFTAIIAYDQEDVEPDSANIMVGIRLNPDFPDGVQTYAIVDNFRFDGFEGDILVSTADLTDSSPFHATIYPNPGSTALTVHLEAFSDEYVQIDLVDMQGRQVVSTTFLQVSDHKGRIDIDTASLPAGLYLVRITGSKQMVAMRWVKQ